MKKLLYILTLVSSMFLFTSCEKDDDIIKTPRKIYIETTTGTKIYVNFKDINDYITPTAENSLYNTMIESRNGIGGCYSDFCGFFTLRTNVGDNVLIKQNTLQETWDEHNATIPPPGLTPLIDSLNYKLLIMADNDTIYYNSQTTPISVSKTLN